MGAGFLKNSILFGFILSLTSIGFAQNKVDLKIKHFSNTSARIKAEKVANRLLNEINEAFATKRVPNFSDSSIPDTAKSNIQAIWDNKPFICPEPQLFLSAIRRMNGEFEVRGIPLLFGKADDTDKSFEEGLLVFSSDGSLQNFYLGLPEHQYKQVMAGLDIQDLRRRQIILDFVENFRTSYNRKDIQFLEKVFSDNALIIVGHVVKETKTDAEFLNKSLTSQKVELLRLNKRQYLDGLTKVFTKNAFIKIGFDDIQIYQHKSKPDFYGVNLLQSWTSSGYSDSGYLFLLIDFRNETEPLVWVRSWQPAEFTKKEEVLSLDQFILQ
ncbi:MAG: hypothetical protein J0L62_11910 [Bacteroidetes bacterium]|nr:hypothetical protein [Bacteroidota bacterium]